VLRIDPSAPVAMTALAPTPRPKMMAEMAGNAQILRLMLMLTSFEMRQARRAGMGRAAGFV
jgi:hypothetical protein